MVYLLSGISRILNKNIMVGDVHQDDHHKNLNRILQRILVHNLTVRREKCKFRKTNFGIPCPSIYGRLKDSSKVPTTFELLTHAWVSPLVTQIIQNRRLTHRSCWRIKAKMTPLPNIPWDVVKAIFCGLLSNHIYFIFLTDQYSRYPAVELVTIPGYITRNDEIEI